MSKNLASATASLWQLPIDVIRDAVDGADDPAAAAALREVNHLLTTHLEYDGVPGVVRRDGDGGKLIEMLRAGQFTRLHHTVASLFDIRRIQP